MNTHNAVPVESPRNFATDTNDVGGGASAEHPESGPAIVRVSLFGFSIELTENASLMPSAILGC